MDNREKVKKMIKEKTDMDDLHVQDMEKGIYNWCIDECGKKRISRNWNNPRFARLYIEKARSILLNVNKDSYIKNNRLLTRLNEKEFAPHELAYMKPENVFPEMWSGLVEDLMKRHEHAYENQISAMTEMFTCGRCKKNQTIYSEVFCRSADEPSVFLIRCVNCNNRWRQ